MTNLRVWWIQNPPNKPRYYPVLNIEQAKETLKNLATRDLKLGARVVANAGGLEIFEDNKWSEYYNDYGQDIDEIMSEEQE